MKIWRAVSYLVVAAVMFGLGMACAYRQDSHIYKPYMDKLLTCEEHAH